MISNVNFEKTQSDWNVTNPESDDYIKNKPTKLSQFTNDLKAVDIPIEDTSGNFTGGNVEDALKETFNKLKIINIPKTPIPQLVYYKISEFDIAQSGSGQTRELKLLVCGGGSYTLYENTLALINISGRITLTANMYIFDVDTGMRCLFVKKDNWVEVFISNLGYGNQIKVLVLNAVDVAIIENPNILYVSPESAFEIDVLRFYHTNYKPTAEDILFTGNSKNIASNNVNDVLIELANKINVLENK